MLHGLGAVRFELDPESAFEVKEHQLGKGRHLLGVKPGRAPRGECPLVQFDPINTPINISESFYLLVRNLEEIAADEVQSQLEEFHWICY